MKAVIKRELKNYLKNPIFWIGLIFVTIQLYLILKPYLQIHYFSSEQEIQSLVPENIADADITEGYVLSTEEEQMDLTCQRLKGELAQYLGIAEQEAEQILNQMRQTNMSIDEMSQYLAEQYDFYAEDALHYYYQLSEYHQGSVREANDYIDENLSEHSFSYYFARKFADFSGLFMGFFAMLLLAFLFIRDTKKDAYELLHTKPIHASKYILGKICGGFGTMLMVWGFLVLVFGGLCEFYGRAAGFWVSWFDFLQTAMIYIWPNMLMITCVYTIVALVFKNPLPALPCLFLYIVYSNMGSIGPDGNYGYYGRPLAIMVRFPGKFFETTPPPLALQNQIFLIGAAILIIIISINIWKRRRVY